MYRPTFWQDKGKLCRIRGGHVTGDELLEAMRRQKFGKTFGKSQAAVQSEEMSSGEVEELYMGGRRDTAIRERGSNAHECEEDDDLKRELREIGLKGHLDRVKEKEEQHDQFLQEARFFCLLAVSVFMWNNAFFSPPVVFDCMWHSAFLHDLVVSVFVGQSEP